jgi:murein L,D-transpeptidase YcbB/YkuD
MTTIIRSRQTFFLILLFSLFQPGVGKLMAANVDGYSPQAELLQQQINRYTDMQKSGGWKKITLNKKQYLKGESGLVIKQVKQRLVASGDYNNKDTSQVFTSDLETAIRKVQYQYGFKETGVIDALLISALNVPVEARIRQLQINQERARTMPASTESRRIIVNIPEYKLHVYEGGTHIFDMNVVVGTEKNRTAIFNDELTHIVFSPYWNVPASIVQNEILPSIRKKRNYLSANGYEKTGTENGLPKIRQKPGKGNSLGLVKFLFPNEHDIYFHDTPAKTLFSHRIRAYSHGCVRLEDPARLAEYLLQNNPSWTPAKINDAMHAGQEQWVKLEAAVPVSITYFTAWVDHKGVLHFRDDVYEMDKGLPIAAASGKDDFTAKNK